RFQLVPGVEGELSLLAVGAVTADTAVIQKGPNLDALRAVPLVHILFRDGLSLQRVRNRERVLVVLGPAGPAANPGQDRLPFPLALAPEGRVADELLGLNPVLVPRVLPPVEFPRLLADLLLPLA